MPVSPLRCSVCPSYCLLFPIFAVLSCGSVSLEQAQDICRRMQGAGAGMVIATRGSEGAVLFDGQDFYLRPPQLVEAVDTLGAGDSYIAGFLTGLWEGRTIEGAMERGAACATETLGYFGAW